METEAFLKMDIFFVVTTGVVLVLGILISVMLFYLVRVMRDVSEITKMVKKEAKDIAKDIDHVRENVKEGVETAKTYTKAVAGTAIVQGVGSLLQSFAEEKAASATRAKSRKKKKSD